MLNEPSDELDLLHFLQVAPSLRSLHKFM